MKLGDVFNLAGQQIGENNQLWSEPMTIQKITHDCGCVLTQNPESGAFVASTICNAHRPLSSAARGAGTDLYGQLDEHPDKPTVNLSKAHFASQVAREAGIEQMPPIDLPDISMLARPQAPRDEVGNVVVSCYVWGRLQRLLDTLKKNCTEGDSEYSQIGAMQDLLWRCAHGKGVVTQRVTPQSSNERDSEWRSALREALKDCAAKWGVDFSNVEVPTSGPAVFALVGMFVACHIEGRKAAAKKASDAIYEIAMGHKS